MGECQSHETFVKLFEVSIKQVKETVEKQMQGLGCSIDRIREATQENGAKLDKALESIRESSTKQAITKEQIRVIKENEKRHEIDNAKRDKQISCLFRIVWMGGGVLTAAHFALRYLS